jgi:hypothetical protein
MGVGSPGRQVKRAGPKRAEAHSRPSSEPAVCSRHERSRLFMSGNEKLDARSPERLDDVEILLAGNAEDVFDAFVVQSRNQQVGSFGHFNGILVSQDRAPPRVAQHAAIATNSTLGPARS